MVHLSQTQKDSDSKEYCVRDSLEHRINTVSGIVTQNFNFNVEMRVCIYRHYRSLMSVKMTILVKILLGAGHVTLEVIEERSICIKNRTEGPGHGRS